MSEFHGDELALYSWLDDYRPFLPSLFFIDRLSLRFSFPILSGQRSQVRGESISLNILVSHAFPLSHGRNWIELNWVSEGVSFSSGMRAYYMWAKKWLSSHIYWKINSLWAITNSPRARLWNCIKGKTQSSLSCEKSISNFVRKNIQNSFRISS